MNQMSGAAPASALAAKKRLSSNFLKKGVTVAILSGMCYGLYATFLTLGMGNGVWVDWYDPEPALLMIVILGAAGSAINDTGSAIWTLLIAGGKGKLGDFFRCLKSKPGAVMITAAIIGGPIASTAFVVALKMAGTIIIPITALCPAIGAILGRVLFKQELNKRMMLGVLICVGASIMIGSTGMVADAAPNRLLGICIAFIAALGWGIEGCVAGYGTSLIDYEIGITIRQTTSGLTNLFILLPILCVMSGSFGLSTELVGDAVTDWSAMKFFIISSFFAVFAYSLWYKGNSMCGAALGMACNGAYSFWGPFFGWIIIGIILGQSGNELPPIAWAAAVVMVIGIFFIAMNPIDLFRKKEDEHNEAA